MPSPLVEMEREFRRLGPGVGRHCADRVSDLQETHVALPREPTEQQIARMRVALELEASQWAVHALSGEVDISDAMARAAHKALVGVEEEQR